MGFDERLGESRGHHRSNHRLKHYLIGVDEILRHPGDDGEGLFVVLPVIISANIGDGALLEANDVIRLAVRATGLVDAHLVKPRRQSLYGVEGGGDAVMFLARYLGGNENAKMADLFMYDVKNRLA